ASPVIYTLSLHDALPICLKGLLDAVALSTEETNRHVWIDKHESARAERSVHLGLICESKRITRSPVFYCYPIDNVVIERLIFDRSEEHTSELQSRSDLVC